MTEPKHSAADFSQRTAELFQEHRALLFAVAYRMLGSADDAQDVIQEAFVSLNQSPDSLRDPRAFLVAVVTRRSIDLLRRLARAREEYVGPWLPEPVLANPKVDPALLFEGEETLSMAFLLVLERLSPPERAVLLLRDVFDFDYAEVSSMLGLTVSGCRKLNERARKRVRAERKRTELSKERQRELLEGFLSACHGRNIPALLTLLQEDVIAWNDGGGRVAAAINPICGSDRVVRFFLGLIRKYERAGARTQVRLVDINGEPAFLFLVNGRLDSVTVLEYGEQRITGVLSVRNPDKLRYVNRQLSAASKGERLLRAGRQLRLLWRAWTGPN